MLAACLVLALLGGPTSAARPPVPGSASDATGSSAADPESTAAFGELVLGPADRATFEVVATQAGGEVVVATVVVRPDGVARLQLAAGTYRLRDRDGRVAREVVIGPASVTAPVLPGQRPPVRPEPADERGRGATVAPPVAEPRPRKPSPNGRWRVWGAPVLSAVVPGLGQAVNRQGGKAAGIFASEIGLVLGSVALARAGDRLNGADPGRGPSSAAEIARLGALSALTSAAALLYLGQIMDAHAVARGRRAEPPRDYAVAIHVARASTVGIRPGRPRHALYDDFTVSVLGQVAPRVAVGLSDLSLKLRRGDDQLTAQAGARATYRFYDRGALWLDAGGGLIAQGTTATRARGLDPAQDPQILRHFGAIVYAQLDLQWFLLDRWSIDVFPRLSLPLTARNYRPGQQIPRFAPTFELGAGIGLRL